MRRRRGNTRDKAAQTAGAAIVSDTEIREWIQFACDCNGCPEIADRIEVRWSKRMTRAMGSAVCEGYRWTDDGVGPMGPQKYWEVALSVGLFGNAGCEDRYNTIIHEACHCIRDYKHGTMSGACEGHDLKWGAIMRNCGIKAERYHSVSRKGLVTHYIYECPNGCDVFKVTTRMHNSIVRGRVRICRKCRGRIKWTGKIE